MLQKPNVCGTQIYNAFLRTIIKTVPHPYAPMHSDVVQALAVVMCILGCHGAAVALLVSFDCWLRISEVAGLRPGDVVDNRGIADPAGAGCRCLSRDHQNGTAPSGACRIA